MIGYPNFIMDPKELDKVFNDVSGLHLPRRLPDAHVRKGQGWSDLGGGDNMLISLYQSDPGWGLGIWDEDGFPCSFVSWVSGGSCVPGATISHCPVVIARTQAVCSTGNGQLQGVSGKS